MKANPDDFATERARRLAWRRKNREVTIASRLNCEARKKGICGSISGGELKALYERYKGTCLCCGARGPLTADHIVPVSQKGSNTIENIQPLCMNCNSKKGAKTIDYRPDKSCLWPRNDARQLAW